ncbi:MAG: hypothetical protein IEMM0008_1598 [bacterium]|nr:MAG: hypothetical protein IEMM0008_1598 [bacterium]
MPKETKSKKTLKDKATGDFKKFNEETLEAIEEIEKGDNLVVCKDFEDLKRKLESDDEC